MKSFAIGKSSIDKCPKRILSPKHYRGSDHSCRCDEQQIALNASFKGKQFVRAPKTFYSDAKFICVLSPTTQVVLVKHDDMEWSCDLFGPGVRVHAMADEPTAAQAALEAKIDEIHFLAGGDE